MPDASPPASDTKLQATSVTSVSGGVNIDVPRDMIAGSDVVGCIVEHDSTRLMQIGSTFRQSLSPDAAFIRASMHSS